MKAPDYNKMYYLKGTISFLAFYFLVHLVVHIICCKYNRVYQERDMTKRVEYRTYVLSLFHAPIAVFLSFSAISLVCGENETVFDSDKCFSTPRYIHIWSLLNTVAYFMQDLFFLIFVIGDTSAFAFQTYAHHAIAILTFYETAFYLDWMMIFGCLLLFVEISTIFLSLRTLMFNHGYDKIMFYNLNSILLFFTFLFGRVIYQVAITFMLALPKLYDEVDKKSMTYLKMAVCLQLALMVFGSIALNLYWFILMINTVMRALKRMSQPEETPGDIEVQKLVKPGQIKSDDVNLDSDATDDSEKAKDKNGMPVR